MPTYRRRPYSSRVSAGRRRKVVWATSASGPTTVASGVNFLPVDLLLGLKVLGSSILGSTIMRTHLSISCATLSTDTGPSLDYGLIVYDTLVIAAGEPDPSADFYTDWYQLEFMDPGLSLGAIQTNGAAGNTLWGFQRDIKARRRLHEMNDSAFLCLRNVGSQNMIVTSFIRTLIALP